MIVLNGVLYMLMHY